MDEKHFGHYINFVLNALVGGNPGAVDNHYRTNNAEIDGVAKGLRASLPTPHHTLWRGILAEDKYIKNGHLLPLEHVTYLSFTEDKRVAQQFANPLDWMALTVMQKYPNSKGYMIEYHPAFDEIIFHWSWHKALKIEHYLPQAMETVLEQKEVLLKQKHHHFKLIPYKHSIHSSTRLWGAV